MLTYNNFDKVTGDEILVQYEPGFSNDFTEIVPSFFSFLQTLDDERRWSSRLVLLHLLFRLRILLISVWDLPALPFQYAGHDSCTFCLV